MQTTWRKTLDRAVVRADRHPRPAAIETVETGAEAVEASSWARSRTKRGFDLACGVLVAPFVFVIVVVLAAVSAVVFRAWPFFQQERTGLDHRRFRTLKVRSLPTSFPQSRGKHDLGDEDLGWWSRALRGSHCDELPQLLNVLGGSMSLVGPRPMIDEVLELLPEQDRHTRAAVRPGLTGAWQVSTMGSEPLHECPALDNAYVAHSSFRGDLKLLVWTVRASVARRPLEPVEVLDMLDG